MSINKILVNGQDINIGEEIYSTEETKIGTWIDGKPLYRLVVVKPCSVTGTSSVYFNICGPIENAIVHKYNVYFYDNRNILYDYVTLGFGGGYHYVNVGTAQAGLSIKMNNSNGYFTNQPITAIIEYTKTTDKAIST